MSDTFEEGDLVQLKSGGPILTIVKKEDGGLVRCNYFLSGELRICCFPNTSCLRMITSTDQRNHCVDVNAPILSIEFSTRVQKIFHKMGIRTIGDLLNYKMEDLLCEPGFAMVSAAEVREKLRGIGIYFD